MAHVAAALAPVFLVILVGYGFRRSGFLDEGFWATADKLTYFVLFPALLVHSLALAHLGELRIAGMVVALAGAMVAVALLLLALRPRLGVDGPAFTSVFQGAVRPNTYVGLAAALALFGDAGLTLAAVAVAVMVPLANVLAVTALSEYAGQDEDEDEARHWRRSLAQIGRALGRNPLILACAAGILLNATGIGLPGVAASLLDVLGQAALALGLLSVGAGLDIAVARSAVPQLVLSGACKLVVLPLTAAAILNVFAVAGLTATVAVLFAALPTSATGYVMARQLGGDHTLLAGIITVETIAAVVTLPVMVIVFG